MNDDRPRAEPPTTNTAGTLRWRRTLTATASPLRELVAEYADAKTAADDAKRRLKDVTDAIKAEATAAAPEAKIIDLDGPVPLRLIATTTHWGKRRWSLRTRDQDTTDPEGTR